MQWIQFIRKIAAGGYVPAGAIWLDGSADYLTWTPSGAGDSQRTFTLSAWVKPNLPTFDNIMSCGTTGTADSDNMALRFTTNGALQHGAFPTTNVLVTSAYHRDPSAWMHVVGVCDTTDGTATNRLKLYVNGVEVTDFATDNRASNPTLNEDMAWGRAIAIQIGRDFGGGAPTAYYEGYMAEVIYLDGVAAAVTDLGEFDANGIWIPKDPSGLTFGTNGFHLDFANSAALGTDASGNGNNFTVNSMSSANATNDNPADDAVNDYGNYATPSPLDPGNANDTFANGNLDTGSGSGGNRCRVVPFALQSGKWYWEVTHGGGTVGSQIGLIGSKDTTRSNYPGYDTNSLGVHSFDGDLYDGSGAGGILENRSETTSNTDVWGIAFDADNRKLWVSLNGTYFDSGDPAAGTNADFTSIASDLMFPLVVFDSRTTLSHNFGQTAFNTAPPSGFKAPNTANLPAPTVTDPSAYFGTLTWSGDNSYPRTVTGLTDGAGTAWTPDFAWGKPRDAVENHQVVDVVRGFDNYVNPDITSAENPNSYLSATSGGFSISAANDRWNKASTEHVAWFLKAGGSGSSNTDGSASSTVSVADHNGFAIIKHTNTSGDYTVGHGMGQAPDMLIQKGLGTQGWLVWTADLGVDGYLGLHSNAAVANPAGDPWSDTSPTSSVFTIAGTTWYGGSSFDIVTYAFARTPGLIGIGSYTGNGSADGPYVVVDDGGSGSGFRPAWVMIKRTDSTGYWDIHDNARNPYNVVDKRLHANAADTEATAGTTAIDFVANGFKIRTGSVANINVSGGTYIYLAFAEYPFGGEGISQARAR